MNNTINLGITDTSDGYELKLDILGNVTREFVNVRSRMEDEAVKRYLIREGWTPPAKEPAEAKPVDARQTDERYRCHVLKGLKAARNSYLFTYAIDVTSTDDLLAIIGYLADTQDRVKFR